jgi:carboxyl-terminal processing protease
LERVLEYEIEHGAKGIVLDLRDNPGGSLDASVAICRLLLPANKLIVQTRGRGGEIHHTYRTDEDGRFLNVPIVALVNEGSASAAEIVAACLQDHQRAVVAGQRSHGKGTVQQLLPLESGKSLLKLTWASFWRPSDAKIHRAPDEAETEIWGVAPNAGLEHRFTPEERTSYLEYRNQRDQSRSTTAKKSGNKDDSPAATTFIDKQLQLAIEYLQAKLGDAAD